MSYFKVRQIVTTFSKTMLFLKKPVFMRGTHNSLREFRVVYCIFEQMRPFTHFILKRFGLSTRMLLGDWCHSWPKVFITYQGISPRFWSVVLQESEVTVSPPLLQLPPTWKSNRRNRRWCDWGGRSSFLSPEAESVLEWCLGFPRVSQASPEAPPTNPKVVKQQKPWGSG